MGVDPLPPVLPLPAWACFTAGELTIEHEGPYAARDWPMAANGLPVARVRVPGDGSAHLIDARAGVVVLVCAPVPLDDRLTVSDTFGRPIGEIDPTGLGAPAALRRGTEVVGWLEVHADSAPPGWVVRTPTGGIVARYVVGHAPFGNDATRQRGWWAARIDPSVAGSLRALAVAAPIALALGRV